jgi:solute carrier family 25 carnitine/acylcarnitine transporter 20/29
VLGYGALNALLFVTYNRSLSLLTGNPYPPTSSAQSLAPPSYASIYLAGVLGGLAAFVVSAPTELIKVRAQVAGTANGGTEVSSLSIAKETWRREGLKGMYLGGGITAVRDSIGYGF